MDTSKQHLRLSPGKTCARHCEEVAFEIRRFKGELAAKIMQCNELAKEVHQLLREDG